MPGGTDGTGPLWRGVVVLRVLTLGFAVAVLPAHQTGYVRPQLGWVVVATMVVWTGVTSVCYSRDAGRRVAVVLADLAVTTVLLGASVLVLAPGQLDETVARTPLVTSVWASGPVLAAAVLAGRTGGVLAGTVVSGANWLVRGYFNTDLARDTVLLVGAGFVLGLAATTARRSAEQLRLAARAEAATAERERLARSIHDSVLQVLARVRRRGTELGGEAAELARLAGEQEIALRSLVSAAPPESASTGEVDLRPPLQVLASPRVAVSVPATPVLLPGGCVEELVAVVREALSNTERHAGPDAKSWVLVEDLGDEVVLTVRDDGPGIADGRLADAEAGGRFGIARCIRGRVTELGGTATLDAAPGQGTEWEVRLARTPRRAVP